MRDKPFVLVVDDEEIFLEMVQVQLAPFYELKESRSVDEAFRVALELVPDLVLSDMYMPPGPSGWELAFALRRNPKTRDIPFAFLTSLRDPWAELRPGRAKDEIVRELGSPVFLSKIDDVGHLAAKVGELLGRNGVLPLR